MPENLEFELEGEENPPLCDWCGIGSSTVEGVAYREWDNYRYRYVQARGNVCEGCRDQSLGLCDFCARSIRWSGEVFIDTLDARPCFTCRDEEAFSCNGCMNLYWRDDEYVVSDNAGTLYCEECADNNLLYCDDCGEHFSEYEYENSNYHSCIPSMAGLINNYSYKPRPRFYPGYQVRYRNFEWREANNGEVLHPKAQPTPLYMGVELEVDRERPITNQGVEVVKEFVESHGRLVYLKHDATLDHGFEIVTHPFTYQWAKDNFPYEWLTRLHEDAGMQPMSTAGMHVHVCKSAFTKAHMWKFLAFQIRNQAMMIGVARRNSYQWASWEYLSPTSRIVKRQIAQFCAGKHFMSNNHNTALNMGNSETIELRYFASTLDPDVLKATLGFIDSMYHFTAKIPAVEAQKNGLLGWDKYVSWLQEQEDQYGEVEEYLSSRGLV